MKIPGLQQAKWVTNKIFHFFPYWKPYFCLLAQLKRKFQQVILEFYNLFYGGNFSSQIFKDEIKFQKSYIRSLWSYCYVLEGHTPGPVYSRESSKIRGKSQFMPYTFHLVSIKTKLSIGNFFGWLVWKTAAVAAPRWMDLAEILPKCAQRMKAISRRLWKW